MSRETIFKLEQALQKVLRKYETEYELTTAEIAGICNMISLERELKALIPILVGDADFVEAIETIIENKMNEHRAYGVPEGEILTLEGDEPLE